MVRGEQSAPASHAIVRASPAVARKQADWIVGIEPWKSLGYRTAGLGQYLARLARTGDVWIARTAARAPAGIIVATDGFLLGGFIALLAVRDFANMPNKPGGAVLGIWMRDGGRRARHPRIGSNRLDRGRILETRRPQQQARG